MATTRLVLWAFVGLIVFGVLAFHTKGARAATANPVAPVVNTNAGAGNAVESKKSAEGSLLKVTISTSRTEVTSEGGYGVFADFENVDSEPLKLYDNETMLVVQPELALDHSCVIAVAGFYPTEDRYSRIASEVSPKQSGPLMHDIVIQPKEHYVAFWDVYNNGLKQCNELAGDSKSTALAERSTWSKFVDLVAFVPGNYAFVVLGKTYRTKTEPDGKTYHTFTDQVKLHVALTQIDAMIAAMLGGLLGYIVTALRSGGDFDKFYWPKPEDDFTYKVLTRNFTSGFVVLRNAVSAAVLSAAVTILLSRISDTQFPIKVSVPDFWGALVVGFVAYFVGNNLINRIVGFASGGGGGTQGNSKTPAPSDKGGPAKPASPGAEPAKAAAPMQAVPDEPGGDGENVF